MSKKTTAMFAFLGGVAAGAAIGMLYAPDKGREIRDRLSFRLDKYRDMLLALTEEMVSTREEAPSAAQSEGQKVIKEAKDKAEKLLGDVNSLMNQINSRKEA
jgi:gas vesicle protein